MLVKMHKQFFSVYLQPISNLKRIVRGIWNCRTAQFELYCQGVLGLAEQLNLNCIVGGIWTCKTTQLELYYQGYMDLQDSSTWLVLSGVQWRGLES